MSPEENKIKIASRSDVYEAINSERDYQDNIVDPDPTRRGQPTGVHSVGDFIVMLNGYMNKLAETWITTTGVEPSLHIIRKLAGISVKCMEIHGAPKRQIDTPKTSNSSS